MEYNFAGSYRGYGAPAKGLLWEVMDTRLLKHFLAVYDHRHFGRAADALGMSKQGLSKSIAKLEDSIEAKLFSRGRGGVNPSEFGDALASHARLILAETKIAEDEIAGLKNAEKGEIKIGVTQTLTEKIVPLAVTKILELSPKVEISVVSKYPTELLEALCEGELDLVAGSFRPGVAIPDTLHKEVLFTFNDSIVCGHQHPIAQLAKRSRAKLKLADIEPYPWLVPAPFTWVADKLNSTFQQAGFERPREYIQSDDFNFMRGLMTRSNYLNYGNRALFSMEIEHGLLVDFFVPQLTDVREAVLLTRKSSVLPRLAVRLMKELREAAQDTR